MARYYGSAWGEHGAHATAWTDDGGAITYAAYNLSDRKGDIEIENMPARVKGGRARILALVESAKANALAKRLHVMANPATMRLLKFTCGGHHIDATSPEYGKTGISGYESPESFIRRGVKDFSESYGAVPADGVVALDIRASVEAGLGVKMAIGGPMVDITLPDGAIDYCPNPDPLFAAAVAGNEFGALLAIQAGQKTEAPKKAGALDSVSLGEYVRLWREAGARVGRMYVRDGVVVIVWEDGAM